MSLSLFFHHKYCPLLQVLGSSCDKTLTIWDLQKQQPKCGEFIIMNYRKSLHNLYQYYCDNNNYYHNNIDIRYYRYNFHKHLSTEKGSFVDKIQV